MSIVGLDYVNFLSLMPALMKDGFPINFNIWIKVLQKDCVTVWDSRMLLIESKDNYYY